MQVHLTAHSQSHRLRERMEEAGVRHGQEVRADVRGVRVELTTPEWFTRWDKIKADVFFCAVSAVEVRRVAIEGDGRPLPDRTTLDGLQVPHEGRYDLLNVLIRSNGDLRLIMDDASMVKAAPSIREPATR